MSSASQAVQEEDLREAPLQRGALASLCNRIARSNFFNRLILILIVLTGILAGMETYPEFSSTTPAGKLLLLVQEVILWVFAFEIVVKILAFDGKPWRYFLVGWNLFDFAIVVICFLPLDLEFAAVFRLARLLRTLRLVSALPRLQVLVGALLRSIPSLGYVGILLLLHFYVYAVMGTFLFRDNDPVRFSSLHVSMLTLFEILTLEGWNDILNTQLLGSDLTYDDSWKTLTEGERVSEAQPLVAAAYFVSFIMLGTMIMLNLFTGVIIGSMEDAQSDADAQQRREQLRQRGFLTVRDELQVIGEQLKEITEQLESLQSRAGEPGNGRPIAPPVPAAPAGASAGQS